MSHQLPRGDRRIVVVGTTGSGKTTLARQLSRRLGVLHVELDALHWGPNWTQSTLEEFQTRIERATAGPNWVVDGNYGKVRPFIWPRANVVVWLDYPLPVILWRLFWRTLRRVVTRQALWNDNRERFVTQFFSRDSLFLWAFHTYRRRRVQYPQLFARPENAHLTVIRLRSPRMAGQWLATVASRCAHAVPHL